MNLTNLPTEQMCEALIEYRQSHSESALFMIEESWDNGALLLPEYGGVSVLYRIIDTLREANIAPQHVSRWNRLGERILPEVPLDQSKAVMRMLLFQPSLSCLSWAEKAVQQGYPVLLDLFTTDFFWAKNKSAQKKMIEFWCKLEKQGLLPQHWQHHPVLVKSLEDRENRCVYAPAITQLFDLGVSLFAPSYSNQGKQLPGLPWSFYWAMSRNINFDQWTKSPLNTRSIDFQLLNEFVRYPGAAHQWMSVNSHLNEFIQKKYTQLTRQDLDQTTPTADYSVQKRRL